MSDCIFLMQDLKKLAKCKIFLKHSEISLTKQKNEKKWIGTDGFEFCLLFQKCTDYEN